LRQVVFSTVEEERPAVSRSALREPPLGELVSTNRDREALKLTSKYLRELVPSVTSEQIVTVADFAHMAQTTIDLEEAADGSGQVEAEVQGTRRS
jgi:hypothetical protein